MADLMQFDLVSPERSLASLQVSEVQIPGADGDMTVMADHAPTITSMRPGVLTATGPDGSAEYLVTGGFAEIGMGSTSVLAERAIAKADVTQDLFNELMSEAKAAGEGASDEAADMANKLMADMAAAGQAMGLSA
ncbi:MAG: F0F1 ATP synthase subunit epsilon [Pseudomonadota bacterium]